MYPSTARPVAATVDARSPCTRHAAMALRTPHRPQDILAHPARPSITACTREDAHSPATTSRRSPRRRGEALPAAELGEEPLPPNAARRPSLNLRKHPASEVPFTCPACGIPPSRGAPPASAPGSPSNPHALTASPSVLPYLVEHTPGRPRTPARDSVRRHPAACTVATETLPRLAGEVHPAGRTSCAASARAAEEVAAGGG